MKWRHFVNSGCVFVTADVSTASAVIMKANDARDVFVTPAWQPALFNLVNYKINDKSSTDYVDYMRISAAGGCKKLSEDKKVSGVTHCIEIDEFQSIYLKLRHDDENAYLFLGVLTFVLFFVPWKQKRGFTQQNKVHIFQPARPHGSHPTAFGSLLQLFSL